METQVIPVVPDAFGWFWQIGSFLFGLAFFAAVVLVVVLLVRYLLVATKAAKLYVDSHRDAAPPASAPPASAVPAPAARAPKTPPAPHDGSPTR